MMPPKRTRETVPGTPRSLRELAFVAGMRACTACGDHSDLPWQTQCCDAGWLTRATCPACGTERVYVFANPSAVRQARVEDLPEDLADIDPPELELGEGPSSLIDAKALRAEIGRLGPIITFDFDWDRMVRLQTAYNELAKLSPSQKVERERARLAALVQTHIARRYRVPGEGKTSRGSLDRAAQQAHWDWSQRGRSGSGRLDVAYGSFAGSRLDGFRAAGARFEWVDLRGSNLNLADWSEVELVHCNLSLSSLSSTRFRGARIRDTMLQDCGGARLSLASASIHRSSFARSLLDGAELTDAIVSDTDFERVVFGFARWDRARFLRCRFRGASLEPTRTRPPATMRGAVFEECDFRDTDFTGTDLRGATFERCRFKGAHGVPKHFAGVTLIGGSTDESALFAQLVPQLCAPALVSHPRPVIVADDRAPGADGLAVFELVSDRARLIGRTTQAQLDAIIANRGTLPARGTTYGTSGFLWLAGETFCVYSSEDMPLAVTRHELRLATVPHPIADVTRVALFQDPRRRGRRGVAVHTPTARPSRLVVVQEDDCLASEDPTYPEAELRQESAWAEVLARDLAAWLHVPLDSEPCLA